MYLAMSRFKILLGKENNFKNVWKSRETHLGLLKALKNLT